MLRAASVVVLAAASLAGSNSTTTTGSFTFQAGRCYPQSEASVINTAGTMNSGLAEGGSPKECYDWCVDNFNDDYDDYIETFMGLELRLDAWGSSSRKCMCNHPSVKARESETNIRFARRQSRQ